MSFSIVFTFGYGNLHARSICSNGIFYQEEVIGFTDSHFTGYFDNINVKQYEHIFFYLEEQIQNDTEGDIIFSLKSVLERYTDGVDDSNSLDFYFEIIYDLESRGFTEKALRLLLFIDESTLNVKYLMTYSKLKAQIYAGVNNYPEALEWYQKALDIAYELEMQNAIFVITSNISSVFTEAGEYESALRYIQYALNVIKRGFDVELEEQARLYANAGVSHRRLGQLENAEASYMKSLEISQSNNFLMLIAQNYSNLGNIYKDKGEYNLALDSYNKSLEVSKANGMKFGEIVNYINKGGTFRLMQDFEQALDNLLKAENLLNDTSFLSFKRSLYKEFVLLAEDSGNTSLRKKYEALYDKTVQELSSLEEQNELLRRQNILDLKVLERQVSQQKTIFGAVEYRYKLGLFILAMLLLCAGGYIVYLGRKRRKLYRLFLENQETGSSPNDILPTRLPKHTQVNTSSSVVSDDAVDLKGIYQEIVDLFTTEKIFTDSTLTLESLSKTLGTNTKYVSMSINNCSGLNFNEFVNSFRVQLAANLLVKQNNRNLTAKRLLIKCGFRSKATFYRVFKQHTGLTPVQFKKQSHQQSAS
ncbi:tetratricopeptide repeat protein [Gracilimonas halophila]|uniref:Tetratricopeptide repeat protein n=1 Tax=Gracilimonas halophila TaxID=1834464 RepID=A0ABW5JJL5_9BACT